MRFQNIRNWAAIYLWPVLASEEWTWQIIICPVMNPVGRLLGLSSHCAGATSEMQHCCNQQSFCHDLAVLAIDVCKVNKGAWTKTSPCFVTATCTHSRCSHSWLLAGTSEPIQEQNFSPYGRQNWLDIFPISNYSKHFYQCWIKFI